MKKLRTPGQIEAEIQALRLRIRRLRIELKLSDLEWSERELIELSRSAGTRTGRSEGSDRHDSNVRR